jgi:hypothetical protein
MSLKISRGPSGTTTLWIFIVAYFLPQIMRECGADRSTEGFSCRCFFIRDDARNRGDVILFGGAMVFPMARVLNVDKDPAYPAAVREMKADSTSSRRVRCGNAALK